MVTQWSGEDSDREGIIDNYFVNTLFSLMTIYCWYMRILGIDPGFDRVGIAIVEKKQGVESLIYSTCITTNKQDPIEKRLHTVGCRTAEIINEYTPHHLSIENLFFNSNQKTAFRVCEARGIIIHEAMRAELSIHEYTPLQIKMALTGYGRATKEQVTFMTEQILKVDLSKKIDDECDAIAAAIAHSTSCR